MTRAHVSCSLQPGYGSWFTLIWMAFIKKEKKKRQQFSFLHRCLSRKEAGRIHWGSTFAARSWLETKSFLVGHAEELICGETGLPREQPLIIIHIRNIYQFVIGLNPSTNYWMRLRPKTHENCIILQIIQKPNPIITSDHYHYSF